MLLCYKNSCSLHIDGPVDIIPHGKKIEHLPHDACAATASPWPPIDTVQKLLEAADILLDQCNYDGHGWELIDTARDVASVRITCAVLFGVGFIGCYKGE